MCRTFGRDMRANRQSAWSAVQWSAVLPKAARLRYAKQCGMAQRGLFKPVAVWRCRAQTAESVIQIRQTPHTHTHTHTPLTNAPPGFACAVASFDCRFSRESSDVLSPVAVSSAPCSTFSGVTLRLLCPEAMHDRVILTCAHRHQKTCSGRLYTIQMTAMQTKSWLTLCNRTGRKGLIHLCPVHTATPMGEHSKTTETTWMPVSDKHQWLSFVLFCFFVPWGPIETGIAVLRPAGWRITADLPGWVAAMVGMPHGHVLTHTHTHTHTCTHTHSLSTEEWKNWEKELQELMMMTKMGLSGWRETC